MNVLTLAVSVGHTGLIHVTCAEYPSLLVAGRTLAQVLNELPGAIAEMKEAGATFPTLEGVTLGVVPSVVSA